MEQLHFGLTGPNVHSIVGKTSHVWEKLENCEIEDLIVWIPRYVNPPMSYDLGGYNLCNIYGDIISLEHISMEMIETY